MATEMRAQASVYMRLAAAKAAQLALDLENGRLWPGDLSSGIGEIQDALRKCQQADGGVEHGN